MKFLMQATYISYVTVKLSKFVQISMQTSLDSFLQEVSLKIKKGLEPVSIEFFGKILLLKYYINRTDFITRLCLLPKLFSKMCFVFHA